MSTLGSRKMDDSETDYKQYGVSNAPGRLSSGATTRPVTAATCKISRLGLVVCLLLIPGCVLVLL